MSAEPGGQRCERGETATLMAGVNLAGVLARHSDNCLAVAVSAASGVQFMLTINDSTEAGRGRRAFWPSSLVGRATTDRDPRLRPV
jgi:hypothetical protein